MKAPPLRHARYAAAVACCASFAWLTVAVLPLALYQYFYISLPDLFARVEDAAWRTFLSPLELLGWTPTLSSVDPLVTLIPSFAMLFVLWSGVLFVIVLTWRAMRHAH